MVCSSKKEIEMRLGVSSKVRPNIYLGGVEPSIAGSDDLKRDLQLRGDCLLIIARV